MEERIFGRSGMKISILGFGRGAMGGLMVRGDHADQERAINRALDAGVNYFDTALAYGNGESERNIGRTLNKIKPRDAYVGTKVRLPPDRTESIPEFIIKSLEGSLQQLGREQVDILHFHDPITTNGGGNALRVQQVLDEVAPTFEALRRQGKVRFHGIT
jgi:aryl-alcohol dehydrogenase-like predicted oxidoreductase